MLNRIAKDRALKSKLTKLMAIDIWSYYCLLSCSQNVGSSTTRHQHVHTENFTHNSLLIQSLISRHGSHVLVLASGVQSKKVGLQGRYRIENEADRPLKIIGTPKAELGELQILAALLLEKTYWPNSSALWKIRKQKEHARRKSPERLKQVILFL